MGQIKRLGLLFAFLLVISVIFPFSLCRAAAGAAYLAGAGVVYFSFEDVQAWLWWLVGGVAAVCLLLGVAAVLMIRRKRDRGVSDELRRMYEKIVTEERRHVGVEDKGRKAAEEEDNEAMSELEDDDAAGGCMTEEAEEEGEREEAAARNAKPAGELGNGMLTVTPAALEKLKQELEARNVGPASCFRLVVSPLKPGQLRMVIDRDREGDCILEDDGTRILLLSPDVATLMKGATLDYKKGIIGSGFSVSSVQADHYKQVEKYYKSITNGQ
jgi:Fe-S cluster assembly iron-binding protein IscA